MRRSCSGNEEYGAEASVRTSQIQGRGHTALPMHHITQNPLLNFQPCSRVSVYLLQPGLKQKKNIFPLSLHPSLSPPLLPSLFLYFSLSLFPLLSLFLTLLPHSSSFSSSTLFPSLSHTLSPSHPPSFPLPPISSSLLLTGGTPCSGCPRFLNEADSIIFLCILIQCSSHRGPRLAY